MFFNYSGGPAATDTFCKYKYTSYTTFKGKRQIDILELQNNNEKMNYVSEQLLLDLQDFILERYEKPQETHILFQTVQSDVFEKQSLDEIVNAPVETFQDRLFKIIKEKNLDEVEVYKNGNISRQLFSKIRSEQDYHPTKNTVFALAIGMKLTIDETSKLLDITGYAFTNTSKTDIIIQYFIYKGNYNIFAINEVLDKWA